MDHLNFYLETLDKITSIVNETSAPFAQILMFGGQLPEKEKKTLEEVGKITQTIFEILKDNGYPVLTNGSLQTLQVEGKTYYCAVPEKKDESAKREISLPVTKAETPTPAPKPVPAKEEAKTPEEATLPAPPAAPETKNEPEPNNDDVWTKALKEDDGNVWNVDSQEAIWQNADAEVMQNTQKDDDIWAQALDETKEEDDIWTKATEDTTSSDDDVWAKALSDASNPGTISENNDTSDPGADDIWAKALEGSETTETLTQAEPASDSNADDIWASALKDSSEELEEKKEEAFPNETDWWDQINQTMNTKEPEIKENLAAKDIDAAANTTVKEEKENSVYMPGRAVFNFNGTGFADDKEGKKQTYSTYKDGVFYDLFEIMIVPPVESGKKPEPISAMVAPITVPTEPTPSIPLIATFTFRGKHYTVSSLESMERGRNLCLVHIENYQFLIRGFFNNDMKFSSMICTAGESIKEGIKLEVKSIKQYGKRLNPDTVTKNGLAFKTNEERTELLCNIFPLSDDGTANFVCITRSLDFIDYHYHSENVHGAQEINVNINNEKTIIRCAYSEDRIVSEVVEVI